MLIRKIKDSHENFSKCVTAGSIEGYSIQYRCLTHSCLFETHVNGRKQCGETIRRISKCTAVILNLHHGQSLAITSHIPHMTLTHRLIHMLLIGVD